jgi:hypothetical protein
MNADANQAENREEDKIARGDEMKNAQMPDGEGEDGNTESEAQNDQRNWVNFANGGFGRDERRAPNHRGEERLDASRRG